MSLLQSGTYLFVANFGKLPLYSFFELTFQPLHNFVNIAIYFLHFPASLAFV